MIVQNIIRPGMDVVRPGGLSDCYISQSLWYEPLPGHRQRELGNIWIWMVSDPRPSYQNFKQFYFQAGTSTHIGTAYALVIVDIRPKVQRGSLCWGPGWRPRSVNISPVYHSHELNAIHEVTCWLTSLDSCGYKGIPKDSVVDAAPNESFFRLHPKNQFS